MKYLDGIFLIGFVYNFYILYAQIIWVGSGSGILKIRSWIRIRNKSFRIRNTDQNTVELISNIFMNFE